MCPGCASFIDESQPDPWLWPFQGSWYCSEKCVLPAAWKARVS